MNVGYVFHRMFSMNVRQMMNKVKEIRLKSGKSSAAIFLDMIYCGFKYQAGYMDYALFEMYNLNKEQRKTVITRGINNSFIKRFNNPDFTYIFNDKRRFNEAFSDFIKRDWIDLEKATDSDREAFFSAYPNFFAKPSNGMCGKGIEKISVNEYNSHEEIKSNLIQKNLLLVEAPVYQHPTMSGLHSASINTCRVITIFKDGKANVVAAYLRIGNGKYVDNFNSGGMVVPIEEDRGEIIFPAINKNGDLFEVHPLSGVSIKGFKIPMWNQVTEIAKKASAVIPQVGLVGWDIAVSKDGPIIIEGNDFPGHDIYGLPPHRKDGIGVLPKFEKVINT